MRRSFLLSRVGNGKSFGVATEYFSSSSSFLPTSSVESKKKFESPFNKMKTNELIELVDRRKLNRVGLQGKNGLVQLLYSNTSVVEKRGITLRLLRAYRQLALSRNKEASFWTIARISALINGNHEILKSDCRFGQVDPTSTLTFADKCPLIDVLLIKHFNSKNKHPLLNLSYKEAVGEKANLFISFAYADNFIDLVDALELYMETHSKEYPVDKTYFWFDLSLNNQWTASDQPFEFWAKIFEKTVNEIGHTLCFLSSWENPTIFSRVWCQLEMCYSPRITIIMSRKEGALFQKVLCEDFKSIFASLCKIKAENATSYVPDDKERIFRLIQSMKGGFNSVNMKVMNLIRDWAAASARGIVGTSIDNSSSRGNGISGKSGVIASADVNLTRNQLADITRAAIILNNQGQLDEAKKLFERALLGQKRSLGPEHADTLATVHNLAIILQNQERFEEAKKLCEKALIGRERSLGPEHADTLTTAHNLAVLLHNQGRFEEAEKLYVKAISGYERSLGSDNEETLKTVYGLASLFYKQKRLEEAKKLWERVLIGTERSLGHFHQCTLLTIGNLAVLLQIQGRLEEAKKLWVRVLIGRERSLGHFHQDTVDAVRNLALLLKDQGRLVEAKELYERALLGQERSLGNDHASTLMTVLSLADILSDQGRLEEAKKLFKRALSGFTRAMGPSHEYTKMASRGLARLKK